MWDPLSCEGLLYSCCIGVVNLTFFGSTLMWGVVVWLLCWCCKFNIFHIYIYIYIYIFTISNKNTEPSKTHQSKERECRRYFILLFIYWRLKRSGQLGESEHPQLTFSIYSKRRKSPFIFSCFLCLFWGVICHWAGGAWTSSLSRIANHSQFQLSTNNQTKAFSAPFVSFSK